jgi:RHS repeat-associated protein
MTALAPLKTPDAQLLTPNAQLSPSEMNVGCWTFGVGRFLLRLAAFLSLFLLVASSLHAQVGGDNPTGPSGLFNGTLENVGVDPWTANASRSITDISVAGAVGEYPLALVRTANSRAPSTTEVFGRSGGWNHNYNWILEDSPHTITQALPTRYTVEFPDGRVETFRPVTWDSYYRVRPGADTPAQSGSAGVRERFQPIHQENNNLYADLILPDGGKVEFYAAPKTDAQGKHYYKYHVTAIYDPYGLKTRIDSALTPNQTRRRITKVTEPAGRYLQFSYVTDNGPRIKEVQEFISGVGRRKVQYYYIYCNGCSLGSVVYYSNAAWTARYQYCNANVAGMPLLLKTCDDPMYPGAMKRISYEYKPATPPNPDGSTPVYGQVWKVRYWNGNLGQEDSGSVVSTLTVGEAPNLTDRRKETRPDGTSRGFIYNGAGRGYLGWVSDFTGRQSHLGYDGEKYVNSVTNFNQVTTDYINDPITGKVTQIKYPLTPDDTPYQSQRPTVNYTYTNGYYLRTVQGEAGPTQTTTIDRDPDTHRITQITYPDGGVEKFLSYNSFNQVLTHQMLTGGIESWTYNWPGSLKDTYRNPDNPVPQNPTVQYFYDALGRVNGVFDALRQPTNYEYNDRGQLTTTTLTADPVDGQRHKIINFYNPDGTLQYTTDQLGTYANDPAHTTSYTYDDYRRIKSAKGPTRGQGNNNRYTTYFYYGANPSDDPTDYKYADSNVTYVALPSGKKTKTVYDENRRKWKVTVGYQSGDDATTIYTYDGMGNLKTTTNPLKHNNTTIDYDQRNRPSAVHVLTQLTKFKYDTAGRKYSIERPNGQVITYETYDVMNRLKQQRVAQTPNPDAVTQYTYYAPGENGPVGFLHTMKDPHLVGTSEKYEYLYDSMGRKTWVIYPHDSSNPPVQTVEYFGYDDAGRLQTYFNRNGKTQTFHYDALNRVKWFEWTDGAAPRVDFGYDAASRLTSINNANANIIRQYYNDNLLYKETEQILLTGGRSKTVTYTYDADGNRGSTQYPDGNYNFAYTYTGRNQLNTVNGWATYTYDARGNLTRRDLNNGTYTDYPNYDEYDRLKRMVHHFHNTTRSFDYGYDNMSNTRKWTKREDGSGDAFGYDVNDQVKSVFLDILSPDGASTDDQTIFYDASGNRTRFEPYDWTETYSRNYLNQYPERYSIERDSPARPTPTPRPRGTPRPRPTPPGQQLAAYDYPGNMTGGFDGSTYTYDAQNRLLTASKGGTTMSFAYDGLNRQVSRSLNGGQPIFGVWDGWDLIEEYQSANNGAPTAYYLYGAGGLIAAAQVTTSQLNYYYQDASGSTSYLADSTGELLEGYLYDLQGAPSFLDASGNNRDPNQTAFGVRHLFTGQQWYSDIGLYDLRNRFYSPDIGRFLQPDPIGFRGGNNLYRYVKNNPVTRSDPFGLLDFRAEKGGTATVDRVIVTGSDPIDRSGTGAPGGGGGAGGGGGEGGGHGGRSDNPSDQEELERVNQALERLSNELSAPPPQNPPSPGDQSINPGTSSGSPTQAQITSQVLQAVVVTFPFGGQSMPMTTIKNNVQARQLGRPRGSRVPIFVPVGVNPQKIVATWRASGEWFPFNLPAFGVAFMPGGIYDFKLAIRGGGPIYDSLGNFLYGWSGWNAGISESALQGMGDRIHGGMNDPVNVFDIQLGIDGAKTGGTINVVPVDFSDF